MPRRPDGARAAPDGDVLRLVTTSAIAVLGAEGITKIVPPATLQRLAGAAFVLIGVSILWAARAAHVE